MQSKFLIRQKYLLLQFNQKTLQQFQQKQHIQQLQIQLQSKQQQQQKVYNLQLHQETLKLMKTLPKN